MRTEYEESCLSDLSRDRIVAEGELSDDDRLHLDSCRDCSAKLESLRSASAEARPTVARLIAAAVVEVETSKVSSWRPGLFRFLAFAGTAACLGMVGLWSVGPVDSTLQKHQYESVRTKGTNVRLFVRRDGVVYPEREIARFRPGDELRFSTSNATATFFILVGIGQKSGSFTVYYPFQGEASMKLSPGIDVPLPGSLVLDESPETEIYLATFTNVALSASGVGEILRESHAKGVRSLTAYQELELPGSNHWFEIRRE